VYRNWQANSKANECEGNWHGAPYRVANFAEFLMKRMFPLTTFRDVQLFERILVG
jgi:hypothetical protein